LDIPSPPFGLLATLADFGYPVYTSWSIGDLS
jgi:hypothetical protein